MKKCPKCGEENPNTATIYQKCCAPIDTDKYYEKVNSREKLAKIIKLVFVPVYYIIYIIFFIKCVLADKSTAAPLCVPIFFPIAYLLLMFKTDSLFRLKHIFEIDNPEKAELSDWYFLSSKICACIILALGLFMVIFVYFCLIKDNGIRI